MNKLITYLTFNGNCRQAMTFYQECLGGKLTFQTFEESPDADKMPVYIKKFILHAALESCDWILMGTDIVNGKGLIKGNSVSILINCNSQQEIDNYYARFASGCMSEFPLKATRRGALFGGLTDKFGNHWLFNFANKNKEDLKETNF